MKFKSPTVSIAVDTISLVPGECVTVFAAGCQVEIHVTDGGLPRVLVSRECRGIVRDFDEFYPPVRR